MLLDEANPAPARVPAFTTTNTILLWSLRRSLLDYFLLFSLSLLSLLSVIFVFSCLLLFIRFHLLFLFLYENFALPFSPHSKHNCFFFLYLFSLLLCFHWLFSFIRYIFVWLSCFSGHFTFSLFIFISVYFDYIQTPTHLYIDKLHYYDWHSLWIVVYPILSFALANRRVSAIIYFISLYTINNEIHSFQSQGNQRPNVQRPSTVDSSSFAQLICSVTTNVKSGLHWPKLLPIPNLQSSIANWPNVATSLQIILSLAFILFSFTPSFHLSPPTITNFSIISHKSIYW